MDYFTFVKIAWIKVPEVRKAARDMIKQASMKSAFRGQPTLLCQKLNLNDPDEAGRSESNRSDQSRY